ncbi:MAG TPA: PIG-L family deacetylase [Bryobacterales bacterium]|nr:PIG-L family deacetylase [Bryobacterales bacterium]
MHRRQFLEGSLGAGALLGAPGPAAAQAQREMEAGGTGSTSYNVEVTIERPQPGQPHKGKMLAAIQPHCDDVPIFAGGTVLKLLDEGYEGILITMSNDSMAGEGLSIGEIVLKNERDTKEVARRLGLKEALFLNYPNHNMDAWPIIEMRARLTFLFRLYKIDTVLVYDPSALYERNPDHYVTARAVEWACATAASSWDYPEHFKAGLTAHGVRDRYYYARGPQLVNRVVDIGRYIDQKVYANMANVTQGPAGDTGAKLRRKLAAQGKRLPLLGASDETASRAYVKEFALERDRLRGQAHGLAYAEYYHYVPPDESDVEEYIGRHAVPL